jgi:hypothetical protein
MGQAIRLSELQRNGLKVFDTRDISPKEKRPLLVSTCSDSN